MADLLNKLNSANYITVKTTDDSLVNGNNLLAAYSLAKTKLPNGTALSTSNRLAIILPAAIYDFGTQSLILDTQYIDIIGSTTDKNKHHIRSNISTTNTGVIKQTANDVKLYNLKIENKNTTYIPLFSASDPASYFPDDNLNLTYIENVSFIYNGANFLPTRCNIQYSGNFINCTGEDNLFTGILSGNFTNCTGGSSSFGGTASGKFTNCVGGFNAFAGGGGTASGEFINCTGGQSSFGGSGTANGIFTSCNGGTYSFGGFSATANGTFKFCNGGDRSFGGWTIASGIFKFCNGGSDSFGGYNGTASGEFINCIAEANSFGGGGGTASGKFTNCAAGEDSFGGGGGSIANGKFTNCTGGKGSFNL
jgi:hypothetical protein